MSRRRRSRASAAAPPSEFYHGTSLAAALKIQEEGFRVDLSGSNAGDLLGPGVYMTTTLNKALHYAKTNLSGGVIFRLKVQLGRCYEVTGHSDSLRRTWADHGYDSARADFGGAGEENCIRDPSCIKITDVILGHTQQAATAGYAIDPRNGKLHHRAQEIRWCSTGTIVAPNQGRHKVGVVLKNSNSDGKVQIRWITGGTSYMLVSSLHEASDKEQEQATEWCKSGVSVTAEDENGKRRGTVIGRSGKSAHVAWDNRSAQIDIVDAARLTPADVSSKRTPKRKARPKTVPMLATEWEVEGGTKTRDAIGDVQQDVQPWAGIDADHATSKRRRVGDHDGTVLQVVTDVLEWSAGMAALAGERTSEIGAVACAEVAPRFQELNGFAQIAIPTGVLYLGAKYDLHAKALGAVISVASWGASTALCAASAATGLDNFMKTLQIMRDKNRPATHALAGGMAAGGLFAALPFVTRELLKRLPNFMFLGTVLSPTVGGTHATACAEMLATWCANPALHNHRLHRSGSEQDMFTSFVNERLVQLSRRIQSG